MISGLEVIPQNKNLLLIDFCLLTVGSLVFSKKLLENIFCKTILFYLKLPESSPTTNVYLQKITSTKSDLVWQEVNLRGQNQISNELVRRDWV